MKDGALYIGLDVHKSTISVAVAEGGRGGDVRDYGVVENRADVLIKLVDRLGKRGQRLHFCYEAGPCGHGLHRLLRRLGRDSTVVAPSLIPKKMGERVKTNRRDAIKLARLHRAGELPRFGYLMRHTKRCAISSAQAPQRHAFSERHGSTLQASY